MWPRLQYPPRDIPPLSSTGAAQLSKDSVEGDAPLYVSLRNSSTPLGTASRASPPPCPKSKCRELPPAPKEVAAPPSRTTAVRPFFSADESHAVCAEAQLSLEPPRRYLYLLRCCVSEILLGLQRQARCAPFRSHTALVAKFACATSSLRSTTRPAPTTDSRVFLLGDPPSGVRPLFLSSRAVFSSKQRRGRQIGVLRLRSLQASSFSFQ